MNENDASTFTISRDDPQEVTYHWAAALVLIAFLLVLFFALGGITLFL